MNRRASLRGNFGGAAIILSDLLLPLTPMGLAFGHGIVPEICVEKVIDVVKWVKEVDSNTQK